MRLQELFDTLYRPLRLRGRSPNTTRLYGCVIRAYGRWLGRDPELRDLDELVLARYLEHRATQVALLTVERERSGLMALAGLAWERRLIETKPTCPPGAIPDRVPQAWSIAELQAVMAAASDPTTYRVRQTGRPPLFGKPIAAVRHPTVSAETKARFFTALLPVLYESGERVGAMLEARIEDYDRPHLVVRAEARKGRKRDRVYRFTDATCDLIEAAIGGRTEGLVFAWPMTRTYLFTCFGTAVKAAGLNTRKRLRFHQIRRSAASHYAAAGGDAVEMLDHSSPKITKRWYLDPRLADRGARPCDILPPIVPPQNFSAAVQASGKPVGSSHP
jgi:integrase